MVIGSVRRRYLASSYGVAYVAYQWVTETRSAYLCLDLQALIGIKTVSEVKLTNLHVLCVFSGVGYISESRARLGNRQMTSNLILHIHNCDYQIRQIEGTN